MRTLVTGLVALACLALGAWQSLANPVTDFENEVRSAYGYYRSALARSNSNDQPGTVAALTSFVSNWSRLASKWEKSPPPQYAGDKTFAATLANVGAIAAGALREVDDLPKAHVTLERIRDELASLRARNGVLVFSDRMNAYHEVMEHVIGKTYDGFNTQGLGQLREDAAVLRHLAHEIEKAPPSEASSDPEFMKQLAALKASVEAVLAAARAGDAEAAKKAVGAFKRPYAIMFMRFG